MKKLLILTLTLLMMLSLTGCIPMGGRHPELFVVASNSLLGVLGRDRENTVILDEDDFGRVMFAYGGHTVTSDGRHTATFNILAVLIAQRTTETHSYFYDGVNFILREVELERDQIATMERIETLALEYFTEEQLERLKEENDWNRELDESRFFRVPVSRRPKEDFMTRVPERTRREVYLAVSGAPRSSRGIPLTMDKNGNVIYFIMGSSFDSDTQEWTFYRAFLFMFDANGELIEGTGTMELFDLWDYRDELIAFKEANGWSFYYR